MIMKKLTEDRIGSESQIGSKVYTDCPTKPFFSFQAMLQAPYRMSTSIVAFPWGFATNDNNKVTFQWHIHAIHMLYPINSRPQLIPEHYLSLSCLRSMRSNWSSQLGMDKFMELVFKIDLTLSFDLIMGPSAKKSASLYKVSSKHIPYKVNFGLNLRDFHNKTLFKW